MNRVRKKKHKAVILLIFCVIIAGAGLAIYVLYGKNAASKEADSVSVYKEETVKYGSVVAGISESGTVTFGSQEQVFSLAEITDVSESSSSESSSQDSSSNMSMGGMSSPDHEESAQSSSSGTSSNSETALVIEELCVVVGQVVEEGDPILKISEDSISDYKSELETAVKTAKLLVEQEEINVETKRAEADYNYQMYLAAGKTAEETYHATITSLENAVTDLEEELQESADTIAEYEEELEAGEDVEEELEEEQRNYETIEADLQIAQNNLTTQSIEAKQAYENAMTNYQYADQLYEIDTNGLEDDLDDAKDSLQEAEDALEEFESIIGDGTIYAEYSGTIMSVEYDEGDSITNDAAIVTFSDAENVTITAAVSQDDISQIAIGDEASIALDAYEGESFTGEVSSISTTSSIGSSTVNYDVEVRFTGDIEKVYSGMTGEVTFVEKESTDVLYISNRAVHQDGTKSWVKVKKDDGTIEEVTVKTGFSNGTIVEVEDGLEEGQTVIIESQVNS